MIRHTVIALAIIAGLSPASLGNSDFAVALERKFLHRFKIKKVDQKEFQFTEKQTGFSYTLEIWDDLSRRGVGLYYQQGLESMPRLFKDRGFKLRHKENNSKYMGFTYSLKQEWHMEYMRDFDARLGILISTKGRSAEHLIRLHDVLFLINNVTVVRNRVEADQN